MLDAIGFAHNMWKLQAKFQNLQVMAVSAIGSPGCLDGPELESLIKNAPMCAAFTGNKAKYRDAVAKGVSKCFKDWQGQVMVPGLPWYPAFAAFPGPMAPPMPNIPTPLIACPSAMMTQIVDAEPMKSGDDRTRSTAALKKDDKDKHYEALFDAHRDGAVAGVPDVAAAAAGHAGAGQGADSDVRAAVRAGGSGGGRRQHRRCPATDGVADGNVRDSRRLTSARENGLLRAP